MPWRRQPAHSAELLAHWQALGQALGRDTPAWRAEGRRLLRSWARWPRAYHDTTHLRACLRHLQAVQDYRRTGFGGWPWPQADPVHGRVARRFARYPGQAQDELPGG